MLQMKTQNEEADAQRSFITWTISSSVATTTANSARNVATLAESTTGNDDLIWKTF